MSEVYDFSIIGGGPAGSSAATFLRQKGYSVIVFEKEAFPREHVGESLIPFCYKIFEDLGVLDTMKSKFSRKPGVTFSNLDGSKYSNWCFSKVIKNPGHLSFHVHRAKFDEILLDHAESLGAIVHQETKVTNIDFGTKNEDVTIDVETHNGKAQIKTKFVIDASGQSTFLGSKMKSKKGISGMKKRVAYSSHWNNLENTKALDDGHLQIIQLDGEKQGWVWLIPISEKRSSVGVVLDMEYVKNYSKENSSKPDWQENFYLDELNSSPLVKNIVKNGKRIGEIAINGDYSYSIDNKYSDKFAIIGDASAFLDPIFSSGIYLGMRSAQLVTDALDRKIQKMDATAIDSAYTDIRGAYKLVEKLINTFYDEGSIKFANAQEAMEGSYEKFESAYAILHLVLAGDFFKNYDKYIDAIDLLSDTKMIEKYKNLIGHENTDIEFQSCINVN